jgi:hypothetical protein
MSLQLANLICMYAVQNASSTSALTVTSTSMRACTIALVARVSAVCLDRDANCVHYAGVDLFFFGQRAAHSCKAFLHSCIDGNNVG